MQPEKPSFFSTRFIQFLGGRNTLFLLILILLLGLIIFIFDLVSFVFYPMQVLLANVVLPVILATIGYYLFRPLLQLLMRVKIPKIWGILIIFLGLIGLITLLIVLVFPFLKTQLTNLIQDFPQYFKKLVIDADMFLRTSIFSSYYLNLEFDVEKLMQQLPENIGNTLQNAVGGVANGIGKVISTLTGLILAIVTVPFILFYLLKDGEKLPQYILNLLPPRMREDAHQVMKDADKQISAYIQGQILVAICIGCMVFIGFLIIGMDYALLLGVLAMITSVVPYLGPIIAITPAAVIAIGTAPFMLVKLAVVWTVVQLVEGKFISPQIMGKSLHIHPITIIFVLLTAGSLFGVPGVILGIPGYALLKVLITHMYKLFKRRYNRHETELNHHYD
ncbi:AI-2E family transporter [Paenisporosarcina quisquiliarum]|uniref:AI-2E family transporter n=1 Tax=Paenisporosarcina quisquiliarum TaxID=365346 RepID=A0A9X3LGE5_9BACL|nr:AI-2E family transporter [Paenisporosarcina quisquiliarum]MCZ8535899.1 AI-2E family transporter [Paenisporosarcina quisquiliarum]